MSSPISQRLADSVEQLLAAAGDVAESSLFAFAEPSDEATFRAAAPAVAVGGWLKARVEFVGPAAGSFDLTVPESLTRRLGAAFLGAESPDEITERALLDFAGELANMLCGTWLTRACIQESFDLSTPRVTRGQPGPADPSSGPDDLACFLNLDDAPVMIAIRQVPSLPAVPEPADAR